MLTKRPLVGAFFVASILAAGGAHAADTITHNLGTTATSPLPAGSCLYVDQGPGTDAKLCTGYAAALGAAPATSGMAIQKGNGSGGFAAAVSGTDYAPATSGTAIQKGNGSGGFSPAVAGTDYAAAPTGAANAPLFRDGAGGFTAGTRSGNTTAVVTKDASTPATNDCAKWDASGNLTTAGAACGAGGGAPGGSSGQLQVNDSGSFGGRSLGTGLTDTGTEIALATVVNSQAGTSYTVIASDANKTVRTTNAAAVTLNLTAAATLGSGFGVYVECDGAAGCTIDPAGAETVDGAATLALSVGGKAYLQTDGTGWRAGVLPAKDPLNGANLAAGTVTSDKLASKSGNGTAIVTTTGTQTSGKCVTIDANGNHIADANPCSSASTSYGVAAAGWIATANPDKMVAFTASRSMTVTAIRGTVVNPVGSTAAISVFKAPSGTVCSSGTNLVAAAATFDANGTAATNQTLTLAGSGAPSLSAGDRVCLSTANGSNFTAGVGNGAITIEYSVP